MKNLNTNRKLKNVKIITIYDPNPNYGNRLQNYAVQAVLKGMDFDTVTISFQKDALSGKRFLKYWAMKFSFYHLPGNSSYWKNYPKKIQKFNEFNWKYISTQKIKDINEIGSSDFFVLGSDQVWNPEWYSDSELKKDMFMLTFARPEQKVCFSPSFSIDKLPDEWIPWFKEWLPTFPNLGTREDSGATIIKELTGRDAAVTIDPTLMLDKCAWRKISKEPEDVDCSEKYILTYFLGERNVQTDESIKTYCSQTGINRVYHMNDLDYPELYVTSPDEFIYLVDHATLVLTDSFHACVFSFIFGKPFLCYDRIGVNNMNSRFETLFDKFDLKSKYINSGLKNELLECNYENGYKVLEVEREKMLDFLKKSMKMS